MIAYNTCLFTGTTCISFPKKLSLQEVVILKTSLVSKTKMIAKSDEELEILLEFNRKKILKWEQKCSHNV